MEIKELPGITRFLPKIVLAITVTICDEVYKKIAYWLNDMGERLSNPDHFIVEDDTTASRWIINSPLIQTQMQYL